jgi:hypothetical protein
MRTELPISYRRIALASLIAAVGLLVGFVPAVAATAGGPTPVVQSPQGDGLWQPVCKTLLLTASGADTMSKQVVRVNNADGSVTLGVTLVVSAPIPPTQNAVLDCAWLDADTDGAYDGVVFPPSGESISVFVATGLTWTPSAPGVYTTQFDHVIAASANAHSVQICDRAWTVFAQSAPNPATFSVGGGDLSFRRSNIVCSAPNDPQVSEAALTVTLSASALVVLGVAYWVVRRRRATV